MSEHSRPITAIGDHPLLTIFIAGDTAWVAQRHASVVAPLLEARGHTWTTHRGTVSGRSAMRSFGWSDGERYRFAAKLTWYLHCMLSRRGVPIQVVYAPGGIPAGRGAVLAPRRVPVYAATCWTSAGPLVRELLDDAVLAGLGGVIPTGFGVDSWQLAPDLLRLYPDARGVVAVRNRGGVRAWSRWLRGARLGRPVGSEKDLGRASGERGSVLVCSHTVLDWLRPEAVDLVIVSDVRPLLATESISATRRYGSFDWHSRYDVLRDHRIPAFGFLPGRAESLPKAERLRLAAWFGPTRARRPPDGPGVRVEIAPAGPGERAIEPTTDILTAKRHLWTDPARNARIARLASGVGEEPNPATVLVEGPDHAGELAHWLPSWPVSCDPSGSRARCGNDGVHPQRALVTDSWLARGGRLTGTIIDARAWGPVRPSDLRPEGAVRIIDVAARGTEFERRTASRLDRYGEHGWTVTDLRD
jgi:hypothetical protein